GAKLQTPISFSMKMKIAFGTTFRLGLQQQRGSSQTNEIAASIASIKAAPKPAQPLLPTASVVPRSIRMFLDDTLISIGANQFMAVHLGTQTFNILAPSALDVPVINLTVEIIPPTVL